ncbi:MAG: nucleotide exchange factor GrpE [Blautia sp.]|nr:nucleotide exchange factor GrpE [Blautia sp.]
MAEDKINQPDTEEIPVTGDEVIEPEETENIEIEEETSEGEEIPVEDGDTPEEETIVTDDPGEPEQKAGDAEAPGEGEASPEEEQGKAKTSFFGRRKKESDKFQQQIDELNDKLLRSRAEFDNFRKRTEKEKSSMYIIGARDIIEKILPVVDNFERGLAQAPEGDAFADGMKMIYKQLMTTLEDLGVKPIEAVGQEFNPDFHNAVMHVEDDSVGDNIVVEELQRGYTYKDFVVRHSMVKVAN